MPAQAGEVTVATLFADVHYYLAPPTQNPLHHRFDKGSYVYVHYNTSQGTGRLEIANHAGTPDQDAFAGSLDCAHIYYTYKQTTLFNITIDKNYTESANKWQLPSFDPQNQQKYLYPLHTVDIYFWTPEDAKDFTEALTRIKRIASLRIESKAQPPNAVPGQISPIVQQLEQAAISKPYQDPRRESAGNVQSFPPPPPLPSQHGSGTSAKPANTPAPLAYNPAAPPKPEPIAHREKTPPPADADTGLAAATMHEGAVPHPSMPYQNNQFQNFNHHSYHPQAPSFSGPPSQTRPPQERVHSATAVSPPPQHGSPLNFPPPPPPPSTSGVSTSHQQRTGSQQQQSFSPTPSSSFSPLASSSSPYMGGPYGQTSSPPLHHTQSFGSSPPQNTPSFGPPPTQRTPSFGPPPTQQTSSFGPPSKQEHTSSPPPVGGYSNYTYHSSQGQSVQSSLTYDVHGQAYRPTEQEAKHGHGSSSAHSAQGQGQSQGLGGRVSKVEKGVNRFLKRLDKGI